MYDDTIKNLLKGVADGSILVKDTRVALEDVELTEEKTDSATDHVAHNIAESGTIVSVSLAPSGASYLTLFCVCLGHILDLLLVLFADLWTSKGLGSAEYGVPFGNGTYNARSHGIHLSCPHYFCETLSKQICPLTPERLEGVQVVNYIVKYYDLVVPESKVSAISAAGNVINQRQFLCYGFNTATGVLAASLRNLGFASILLLPGGSTTADLSVKFLAKG